MATLFQYPNAAPVSAGENYASSKMHFYQAGTTTNISTYTTAALSVAHANPVVADANGVFAPIFVDEGTNSTYKMRHVTSADVLIREVDNIPATLNQQALGAVLYPRTSAETAAGVTPTYYYYEPGDVRRYGVVGDGATNDTAALANALKVGYQGVAIYFPSDAIVVSDPFIMKAANQNIPPAIYGNNVTLKARAGSSGVFVTLENPHDVFEGFRWDGQFNLDSNSLCTSAFLLHGSQRCSYGPMRFVNSTGPQCRVNAEANYGVYYNTFMRWIAGGSTAEGGADDGFEIKTTDGTNRIASNDWIKPVSNWNVGHGFDIDRCSDTFVGPSAEVNDGNGFNVDNCPSITFVGGYSEHNHEGMSGGGATDSTEDVSFNFTANSSRAMVFGGRHIGAVNGEDLGTGHIILPGRSSGVTITQTGIAFGGATASDNSINFLDSANIGICKAAGTNKLNWTQSTDSLRSFVKHLMDGELEIDGALNHDGSEVGFYGTAPVAKQTGVAVTAAGVHAALVNLGLISA